jgi:hypothetical protein
MDSGTSPGRVRIGHFADEIADILSNSRATSTTTFGKPIPIKRKPFPMPADDGFWLDYDQALLPSLPNGREAGPEQAVSPFQARMGFFPFQNGQLLAKSKVFKGQFSPIFEPGF